LKFTRHTPDESYIVKAYRPGQLTLHCLDAEATAQTAAQGQVLTKDLLFNDSIILSPGKPVTRWQPRCFAELQLEHLRQINPLQPEMVLLGTGEHLNFPEQAWMMEFLEAGIGFEVMDTAAACRTYNILSSEGRQPVAALLVN